jgi:hypothetical protein
MLIDSCPPADFDWLAYYSQLREHKDNLEQRFQALRFQEGLVAVASVSVMTALVDKLTTAWLSLPIGSVSALVRLVYSFLTLRYFRQVREVGRIMADIEAQKCCLTQAHGNKLRLTTDPKLSIFTVGPAEFACGSYSGISIRVVLLLSVLYPRFLD